MIPGAPPEPRRALVVSVHDVSPRTHADCARILHQLAALGVPACSLLVIPDHHHRGHFLADSDFCAWLREASVAGHEVVIHGYHHQRERRSGERWRERITTRVYTADEGEFFDLEFAPARKLVHEALGDFRQLEIHPVGFIAPAWLLGDEAERALRAEGLEYTTRLGSVIDLAAGRTIPSQSLVWSVRAGWRRQMSRVWNALLFHHLRHHPLLRISIHPCDRDHPRIWRQVCDLITRARADRPPLTYHAWLRRGAES